MKYNKKDIISVATKLGRLVNGGVVGYYAGGKTSEVMRNSIPNELVNVVERHKKVQLGASLAQSFIPGAGVVAMSAAVASLWKMYYDINVVLGIKISDNVGKSLTSAVVTNLSSAGAQIGATAVSEGAKFIPFVGWLASAAISTVSSTAIVYGSAYLYMMALTEMYEVEGKFDIDYLTTSLKGGDIYSCTTLDDEEDGDEGVDVYSCTTLDDEEDGDERGDIYSYTTLDEEDDNEEVYVPLTGSNVKLIKQSIADRLGFELENIISTGDLEDDYNADDDDKLNIIEDLESEFGVSISKDTSELIFVDDIIVCFTGESIWEEDDKYDGKDDDQEDMVDESIERFHAFFKSYVDDEYKDMEVTLLASMFETEAEACKLNNIKSQYYCLAAVSRIEFYLKEWFDNKFEGYSELDDLNQKCIIEGINDISKSRELLPEDNEYYLINIILGMLNDFFVECKGCKDDFIEAYGIVDEGYRDLKDTMFNMDWLLEIYKSVYNAK